MATIATRWVAGCMTGTSLDGLDVALAEITGHGLDMTARFAGLVSQPLPDALRRDLHTLATGTPSPPLHYLRASRALGEMHAAAVAELCERHLPARTPLAFVAAHGQTIWHAPAERLSWQLFDPWPIARKLRVPVVYDLRQADLIAGGEGAPITPIADGVMYRPHADVVVNLGGICNITWLAATPAEVQGEDLTVCNLLLDGLCQQLFGESFDTDGRLAAAGRRHGAVQRLVIERMLAAQEGRHATRRGSLGREQYTQAWVCDLAAAARQLAGPADVLRSAVHAVAVSIVEAVQRKRAASRPPRMVLAGGGARNPVLVEVLAGETRAVLSDELGIPVDAREAMAFAVLGALSHDGVPITLPQVTGGDAPGVAGTWAG